MKDLEEKYSNILNSRKTDQKRIELLLRKNDDILAEKKLTDDKLKNFEALQSELIRCQREKQHLEETYQMVTFFNFQY